MSTEIPDQSSVKDKGTKPAMTNDKAQELKEIAADSNQRTRAFSKYADYNSAYYKEVNKARVAAAETPGHMHVKINSFGEGDVTMIAQIKVDSDGKVRDGHDLNPEAQSMREVELAWQHYLETTPREQQLVIFEGLPMEKEFTSSRTAAIQARGDGGLLQYLAQESHVEARTVELTNAEQARLMEAHGVSREDSALFFTLRSLAAKYDEGKNPLPDDIAMEFYPALAELGLGGIKAIPEEVKGEYEKDPVLMKTLKDQVAPFVAHWDEVLSASGLPRLVIRADGGIGFEDIQQGEESKKVTHADIGKAIHALGGTPLKDIGLINMREARDKVIFEKTVDAVNEGKRPFIVFGGSHVVSLEPVMEEYFGAPDSTASNG